MVFLQKLIKRRAAQPALAGRGERWEDRAKARGETIDLAPHLRRERCVQL